MARALLCPIFKHQPPHQSGCGLAQLCKDLSTPLGTGFGGKPAIRFRHAEEANPKSATLKSNALKSSSSLDKKSIQTYYHQHPYETLMDARMSKLLMEIKAYRCEEAKNKKAAMETRWLPGVNNALQYGSWVFAEFTDVYAMQKDFGDKVKAQFEAMLSKTAGAAAQ
jgi:hypothetical protein